MTNQDIPGAHFLTWLARAAIDLRQKSGARREEIAVIADANIDKIRRFEAAETMPRDVEWVIAAYAEAAGLDDPREIYRTALELWNTHGERPNLRTDGAGELTAGQRFEKEMRGRRARPRAPAESAEKTSEAQKRRAGS